jgi:uncharacterized protein (TIGR03790 family)
MNVFRWLLIAGFVLAPFHAWALERAEVVVVANRFVEESVDLARYYMEKRGIPKENLVRIDTTEKEHCSREDYEEEIARPIRKFLLEKGRKDIRCLVTMFGVPLKVAPPAMSGAEKKQYQGVKKEKDEIWRALKNQADPKGPQAEELKGKLAVVEKRLKVLSRKDQAAAVDSELSLLLNESYPLSGWIPNPYFVGFQQQSLSIDKDQVLLVSRLDGPSVAIVKRVIDDSLAAEKQGLKGTAYFDARYPRSDKKDLQGYAYYDQSVHLAAERMKGRRQMPVVVNDKSELFQAGEAPGAALYCGWYSLSRYVDAFAWQQGAVGYHMASGECGTLRPGSSRAWCKRMLEDGVAATVGPVAEPYLQAFPVPELFFNYLTDGYFSLAEVYFLTTPYLSWQMVLVGDPLYRPFKGGDR